MGCYTLIYLDKCSHFCLNFKNKELSFFTLFRDGQISSALLLLQYFGCCALFRCLAIQVTLRTFQIEPFIESTVVDCSLSAV